MECFPPLKEDDLVIIICQLDSGGWGLGLGMGMGMGMGLGMGMGMGMGTGTGMRMKMTMDGGWALEEGAGEQAVMYLYRMTPV